MSHESFPNIPSNISAEPTYPEQFTEEYVPPTYDEAGDVVDRTLGSSLGDGDSNGQGFGGSSGLTIPNPR